MTRGNGFLNERNMETCQKVVASCSKMKNDVLYFMLLLLQGKGMTHAYDRTMCAKFLSKSMVGLLNMMDY